MRKILFLTGTRADFGKIKALLSVCNDSSRFQVHVFVTGMHLREKYGATFAEVKSMGLTHVFPFMNHDDGVGMDRTLAKTIEGLSLYISEHEVDLIVVHGDRVEALAGAIVGSLNNVLVAHIEGGELSGTIDELIRHSVSKLSHLHFVSNREAAERLRQMGEDDQSIFEIGSPDLDLMFSGELPSLSEVKIHYEIAFTKYAIAMYHPVTTEYKKARSHATELVQAMTASGDNYVVIFPNNDLGSDEIIHAYESLNNEPNFRIFPSIRFEYFLTLVKNCSYMIGNSSAGVREAPYYNVPSINIGSRQNRRVSYPSIFNCEYRAKDILDAVVKARDFEPSSEFKFTHFGSGGSSSKFYDALISDHLWDTSKQKIFRDFNAKS